MLYFSFFLNMRERCMSFIIVKIYLSTYDAGKLMYLYDIYFFNIKLFVVDHAGTYSFYQ